MEIVHIHLDKLIPYENNPRINKHAVDAVANSVREFGFKVPIVVDKDYVIVAGHTRYKAAKKLKLKEVPCLVAEDLTPEKVRAFRLADNKVGELAEWDLEKLELELAEIEMDMSAFGFDDVEEKTEAEEDGYKVVLKEPRSKLGQIYQLGRHRLMCGDSTDISQVKMLSGGG